MNIDKTIIEQCCKKDRRAQEKLYYQVYPYIMGICYRYFISRENAKDIANIAMCKILMNIEQYNPQFAFTTWVSKITVNTILEEFRKNKKHQNIEYVETYYDNASYSDINHYLIDADYEQILNWIKHLNDTEKKIFNLYFIDEYTHSEIAEMMGISEGTSKWYVHQIKQKIKTIIEQSNLTETTKYSK